MLHAIQEQKLPSKTASNGDPNNTAQILVQVSASDNTFSNRSTRIWVLFGMFLPKKSLIFVKGCPWESNERKPNPLCAWESGRECWEWTQGLKKELKSPLSIPTQG